MPSFSHKCLCSVLYRYSQVDLSTQEAYDLAVKGLLRPQDKSPPILTVLRYLRFKPPHFTLGKSIIGYTHTSVTAVPGSCQQGGLA